MSAIAALQGAAVAALQGAPELAGLTQVADAPPVRAAFPYAVVEAPTLVDWSTKTWRGRQGRLSVLLHDEGERPARLRALLGAVEGCADTIDPDLGEGWRLAQFTLARSRLVRGAGLRWVAACEFDVKVWRES